MKKILLLSLGHIFLILGVIGAFLPVLPTTPFLLLAAYCYSKANSRLLEWLKNHKVFGPPLKDWQEKGVIGLNAKLLATLMIMLVLIWRIPVLSIHYGLKVFVTIVLIGVLVFIWTRPSQPR